MRRIPNLSTAIYGAKFHADRDTRTRYAARTILSYVFGWCDINNVCDVGCGVGTWLAASKNLGAETILGYEGPRGTSSTLVVDPAVVEFCDLEKPIETKKRFDLVISLEVAEHLTVARGPSFIVDLCQLGDLVLFSAAIPNQGGTRHLNERWQSYWANLFDYNGYQAIDAIRPLIWNDANIPRWYRQNTLLYARRTSTVARRLGDLGFTAPHYIDLVHPELFIHAEQHQPGRAVKKWANRLLGQAR